MSRRLRPYATRRAAGGQSMVEFIIVAPVLLFLILAIIQFVLLYRMKATLDYAALEAARAGAVHGADKGEMKKGLARGMTPLFAHKTSLAELEMAHVKSRAEMTLYGKVEVINPTRAAWNEHKEKQYDNRYALPNDSLAFRSDSVGGSGVNVQDANILKIRVTYQAPLVVPFVSWVLRGKSDYLKSGAFEGSPVNPITNRMQIESYAIVRMQSPIYENRNLDN
jgi:TadE-like protein